MQYYSLAAEQGKARWVRAFLWWKDIQRSDGTYDWEPYDRAYNEALRVGLKPQLVLCGCRNPPDTEAEWRLWDEFVRRAVARYPRAMFEAWNEPNLGSSFWDGAPPNPAEYLRLLRSVSQVAGPARTIPAGLAPIHSATECRMPPLEFLKQVGVDEVKRLTERIDIHLYPRNQGRELALSEWVDSTVSFVRPLRQLVGPKERIQVGEVGFNSLYLPSEAIYADLTRETFNRLDEKKRVGPIFWFRLYQNIQRPPRPRPGCALDDDVEAISPPPTGTTTSPYGVLGPDGSPLLPFWELAR
ncbi:MAG: hypothetical protein ACRDL1_11605 [Solirubrobacterales bacterium]